MSVAAMAALVIFKSTLARLPIVLFAVAAGMAANEADARWKQIACAVACLALVIFIAFAWGCSEWLVSHSHGEPL